MMSLHERLEQEHLIINANEEHEVAFWMQEFGVSRHELEQAVIAVGVGVEDVRAKLRK